MSPKRSPKVVAGKAGQPDDALTQTVGENLRRIRSRRGLSLERLAQDSGVSRSMLGQIELGQSAPTINVLWKIAQALELPFSAFLSDEQRTGVQVIPAASTKKLSSMDGKFTSRALFPYDAARRVELYELRLLPGGVEHAEPHAPGTLENLVVNSGELELDVGGTTYRMGQDDAVLFEADVPHVYRNAGKAEAVLYLVMTYAER